MMLPAASLNNRIFKGGSVVLGEYMLSAVLAVAGGLTMRAVMESSKNPKK